MFAINNLERIDYFADRPAIISIFLATEFEKQAIEWLFSTWTTLHFATGNQWYLLVPTLDPIDGSPEKALATDFNSKLALELLARYNINPRESPCIVFDDLNENSRQHYVSLAGKTETELRNFIYDCGDIIKKQSPVSDSPSVQAWRANVIGDIFNDAQAKKYGKKLLRLTPLVGSLSKFLYGFIHPGLI